MFRLHGRSSVEEGPEVFLLLGICRMPQWPVVVITPKPADSLRQVMNPRYHFSLEGLDLEEVGDVIGFDAGKE